MNNWAFLTFIPSREGLVNPAFFYNDGQNCYFYSNVDDIPQSNSVIITFDLNSLLKETKNRPDLNLFGIENLFMQTNGKSKDEGGSNLQKLSKHIKKHSENPQIISDYFNEYNLTLTKYAFSTEEMLCEANICLKKTFENELQKIIKLNDDFQRFIDIEIPTAITLGIRERLGIKIDKVQSLALLDKAKAMHYKGYIQIAELLNISPTNLNFHNISPHLHKTDFPLGDNVVSLQNEFKLAKETSQFADIFWNFQSTKRDLNTLLKLSATDGQIFPQFQTWGTVTSRILVRNPPLQQLKKNLRGCLKADDGYEFLYLDYGQFEPAILADLSGDSVLIDAYYSDDLYAAVSESVFNNREKRQIAKRLFLAFMYGMSINRMARLLLPKSASESDLSEFIEITEMFFSHFKDVSKYKAECQNKLEKNGLISSKLGNPRLRSTSGKLTYKEQRWAVNHPIQSTGSLIFKNALLKVSKALGNESIILPMHDAILMQVKHENAEEFASIASQQMSVAFTEICPNVSPKINPEIFSTS